MIDFGSHKTEHYSDLIQIDKHDPDEFDLIENYLEEDIIQEMHYEEYTEITLVAKPVVENTDDDNFQSKIKVPALKSKNTYNFKLIFNQQEYPLVVDKQSNVEEVKEAII